MVFKKGQNFWLGRRHSEETKRKLSLWHKANPSKFQFKKGNILSEETRKKISEAHKGKSPWNKGKKTGSKPWGIIPWIKGKHHTKEAIEKNRLAHLGRPAWNKGKKGVQTAWNKGIPMGEEAKKKSRISHKGMKPWNTGKKGVHLSPKSEFKKGLIPWSKGKHLPKELKKKISESTKKAMATPEIRRNVSEAQKKRFQNPKELQRLKEMRAKMVLPIKDTKPEVKIQTFLRQLRIDFLAHKYMKEIKHSYQADIFIPSMNLVIECDGNYWHKYPVGREIDHIRTKELIEKGFRVVRLWESEIKEMNIKEFAKRIK